jgi:sulfide:quinone oxidoreductase
MKTRILVLGAGFGGLELATMLSEELGERLDLTLIDKSNSFVFGFSKLDAMFHHADPCSIRLPYAKIVKSGVRFVQDQIVAIDPENKRVTTTKGVYEADVLVVALGADYDLAATPGLVEAGNEFYTVSGALRLREVLPTFTKGHAIVGVCSSPFKCPPAPCEAALMLHDFLTKRGVRDACRISLISPFRVPIPPSPETSKALLEAFEERGIDFIPNNRVLALNGAMRVAVLDDGRMLPYDLFLGIPKHCAPEVVIEGGLAEDGWIKVDPTNLRTRFDNVYAIGDVADSGVPKAGLFAEGGARVVAASILHDFAGGPPPPAYTGSGSCYIEYGGNKVGRVDIDFLSGPSVTAKFYEPSTDLVEEKVYFGSSRRARWFGME